MDSGKLVKRLQRLLKRDFADWIVSPIQSEYFWEEANQTLAIYESSGNERAVVQLHCANLHTWHFTRFAAAALNENRNALDELALAARYGQWAVHFEERVACLGRGGILPREAAAWFALQIVAGWREQAGIVGRSIYKGLDTPLVDMRINERHDAGTLFRHMWFLIHLYCDVGGHPLDASLYSYPKDMSPYAQVLADWRTADLGKVHDFVCAMAEFHLAQTDDSKPDTVKEFDYDDWKLFPYEILAYLRLREWNGLQNPNKFDHPLMNQPLARLPQPVPLAQPETTLLDRVIERFRAEFPGLPPTR
jgi:hypothetical protein